MDSNQTQLKIEFKGLDEIVNKLQGMSGEVEKHLQLAINASLVRLKEGARAETPVVTGRLKGGIEDFPEVGSLMGWVKSTVFYGEFVHKRNPFMTRGMQNSKNDVTNIFQRAINNITQLIK
jgi:hypothetical protein